MGKLTFSLKTTETAPCAAGDFSPLLWAFLLVAAMSAVAFAAVWVVTTALIVASPS